MAEGRGLALIEGGFAIALKVLLVAVMDDGSSKWTIFKAKCGGAMVFKICDCQKRFVQGAGYGHRIVKDESQI